MEIKRIGKRHPDPKPFRKTYKKYYEPLYGTPNCPYEGNKRGRKSMEERQRPSLKVENKKIIIYFD